MKPCFSLPLTPCRTRQAKAGPQLKSTPIPSPPPFTPAFSLHITTLTSQPNTTPLLLLTNPSLLLTFPAATTPSLTNSLPRLQPLSAAQHSSPPSPSKTFMAPKKMRKKAVAQMISYFVNDEAAERHNILKDKPVIFERGFQIEKRGWSMDYINQMEMQGWSSFCHPRTNAILPWVYEFYANAKFHSEGETMVRGKLVNFSEHAINSFFDIPQVEGTEFDKERATIPPKDIASFLCSHGEVRWVHAGRYVLDSANFSRPAKVWMMFVHTNIMPTKNSNHVSIERAYLIYCILRGTPVNVGRLIFGQLCKKLKSEGGQQLWYPTLITELCRAAGVPLTQTDVPTPVAHHITQKVISSYIKQQPKKTAPDPPTPFMASSSKPVKSRTKAALPDPQFDIIMDHLNYLATAQRHHHRHMDAYLDVIREEQVQLLKNAGLSVNKKVKFSFSSPFDY